jgi:hypothetical protein
LPAGVVFAEFDATVPFGGCADEFHFEQGHEFAFDFLCFGEYLFLFYFSLFPVFASFLFEFEAVLLDFVGELPA